jgi:uncharacterized protein (TIGR01777 family)
MKILITGSSGLVGTALLDSLRTQGHEIVRLVRPAAQRDPDSSPAKEWKALWDPNAPAFDSAAEGADAFVHLAGASIGDARWTAARKRVLYESRVAATRPLVDALAKLRRPPRVFIAASAIGFYGDRGEEDLTETSSPGTDFLAVLSRDWEAESMRAADFGARVAILRIGLILAKSGGALPRMAMPFRMGVGGRIGSGRQWISWITLEDVVAVIEFAAATSSFVGPTNVVTPHPARNAEFASALGRVLHRPAIFPTPGFALRLALGEMADALLLSSQRVRPQKLGELGYRFAHPDLVPALESLWNRPR